MKNTFFIFLMASIAIATLPSCETVPPGHKGVEVSWGGETNLSKVYGEGLKNMSLTIKIICLLKLKWL